MSNRARTLTVSVALVFVIGSTACGGSDDGANEATVSTVDSGEGTTVPSDVEGSDPITTTTTTTEPVVVGMSASDAEEMYSDYLNTLESYLRDSYMDGDAEYEDAIKVIEHGDPAILDGEAADLAIDFHNCTAQDAPAFLAAEIGSLSLDVDFLGATEVRTDVWALEVLQTVKVEGFPESVEKSTVIVTAGGVGPTVPSTDDIPANCPFPRSTEGMDLIAEVEAFLAAK